MIIRNYIPYNKKSLRNVFAQWQHYNIIYDLMHQLVTSLIVKYYLYAEFADSLGYLTD